MSKAKKIAVCIDSSLFLAEIFGNEIHSSRAGSIDKLREVFTFQKFMSETVKNEVEVRLDEITNLIGQISRDFISELRTYKANNPNIELDDFSFIQSFFKNLKHQYPVNKSEHQIIENLESVLVNYLIENASKKQPQQVSEFVISAMVEFNKILSKFRFDFFSKLDEYQIINQQVDPATCEKLRNEQQLERTVQRKPNDIRILCEVEAFQQSSGKKCLLATLDQKDLLDNSALIDSLIGIKCVDPIYLAPELSPP